MSARPTRAMTTEQANDTLTVIGIDFSISAILKQNNDYSCNFISYGCRLVTAHPLGPLSLGP